MSKRKKLMFKNPLAGLFVSRGPIAPELPGNDPIFQKALEDESVNITDEGFRAAEDLRIKRENYSFEEKKITQRNLEVIQLAEFEKLGEDIYLITEFKNSLVDSLNSDRAN